MNEMKALVFHGPGDIRLERRKIPEAGTGELLVRVKSAGVCATDIRIYKGTKTIEAPRIIGHEIAGDIAAVGDSVKGFAPGERVTVYPMIACNDCYACREGRTNICVNRKTLGYEIDGGFAEYVLIPAAAVANGNVSLLPDKMSYEEGAASESLAAIYNGSKRANILPDSSVLIIGAGPVGLLHTQLAKIQKAGLVIVSEPRVEKRAQSKAFGADIVLDPVNENLQDRIKQLTAGKGVDSVIVCVGIPEVVEESLRCVRKGGTCVIFAGFPVGNWITIDPNLIHYKEIVLTGSSASKPEYQREMLSMVADGKINLKAIISNVFPAERWKAAFKMKASYDGLKSVLIFNG